MPAIPDFSLETAPLRANLSIEASAGTGKTYTLERIVCRLIEHYGLGIKQILLVTYTDKAAAELRQRIRRRLSLRLQETNKASILQALNQFNEANISTIHSFFRCCLEQFPLETGQNGLAEIDPHADPVRELLLLELHKNDFSPQSERLLQLSGLISTSTTASKKQQKFHLQKLLDICSDHNLENFWHGYANFRLCPGEIELEELESIRREFAQKNGAAYRACRQLTDIPRHGGDDIFANRSSKKKLKNLPPNYDATTARDFFDRLRNLLENPENPDSHLEQLLELLLSRPPHPKKAAAVAPPLAPYIELLCCLHPQNLQRNNEAFLRTNGSLEAWTYYEKILPIEQFFAAFSVAIFGPGAPQSQSLQNIFAAKFLLALRQKIAPQLQFGQLRHGIRSFADMVDGLYRVLVLEQHGDAHSLRRNLRQQYCSVLVDEFQDTDPIQWQIIFNIFGAAHTVSASSTVSDGSTGAQELCRRHNFIIVGDPKQSIYRFRGASFQLYQQVRRDCDYRFRLGDNYRSHPAVIAACNQIFASMWGASFEPVAAGREEVPLLQMAQNFLQAVSSKQCASSPTGQRQNLAPPAALDNGGLCFLDCDESGVILQKPALRLATQEAIGQQVLRLLSCDYQLAGRPVQPDDIAILLGRQSDCVEMCQLLQTLGIPTRHSQRRSVFLDYNARSLHYFFLALCQPHQHSHSLCLLLSPLFGLNVQEATVLLPSYDAASLQIPAPNFTAATEFSLSFMQQLFRWQEQVENGQLLEVLAELFSYGKNFYLALRDSLGTARTELQQDVYSRLLGRPRSLAASDNFTVANWRERQDNLQSYSNLRHLVEILATEQVQRGLGCRGLSRFLAQQIKRAEAGGSEGILAETEQRDSNAGQSVRVMTIHAAKGLEFAVVLLGLGLSEGQREEIILQSDLQTAGEKKFCYRQTAYLLGTEEVREIADRERYAELQRLFYVALTRAFSKIYLPFHAACTQPLPYLRLLGESLGTQQIVPVNLRAALEELLQKSPEYFCLQPAGNLPHGEELQQLQRQLRQRLLGTKEVLPEEVLPEGRPLANVQNLSPPDKPWRSAPQLERRFPAVSSFTSLQHRLLEGELQRGEATASADNIDHLGSFQDKERDELPAPTKLQMAAQKELYWHELLLSPGVELGKLLHDILENIDYQMIAKSSIAGLLDNESFKKELSLLSRRYFPRNWIGQAYPALCRLIWRTLHCDLARPAADISPAKISPNETPAELRLCQLSKEQRRHELEFLLTVPADCCLDGQLFSREDTAKIQIERGFIKGFIDLLFLHDGKLYLLDWKSNLAEAAPLQLAALQELSTTTSGDGKNEKTEAHVLRRLQRRLYGPQALEALMSRHHYKMQYLIYLAAVYYYLQQQYGADFEYARHFGGCYYLFLRGLETSDKEAGAKGKNDSGVYFHKPPEELLRQILRELGLSVTGK